MEGFLGLLVTSIIGVRVIPDFVSLVVFIRFRKRHGKKKIHASFLTHSQCASLAAACYYYDRRP